MRKFVMTAVAGLALAIAVPLSASASPAALSVDAIRAAVEQTSPVESVRWHCRRWSGWCRGHWRGSSRGGGHRRWRSRRW